MRKLGIVLLAVLISGCSKPEEAFDDKQYIVVFKKGAVRAASSAPTVKLGKAKFKFNKVLQGGVYHLEDHEVEALRNDPGVAYVEKDQIVSVRAVQNDPEWGLDRIDQANLPLNGKYQHDNGGVAVNVYVIDTGVLASHSEFGGRARSGYDLIDKDADSTDCDGHGTHVAGTIGSDLYGVAKNVNIFGVRVLNCRGSGTFSSVIAGIEWVAANHSKPAVANMSLGGLASAAVDEAVNAAIQAGVTFVVAAGNDNSDACGSSPARVPAAITVGASDPSDARASFSNFGSCVDIFAPGKDIRSLGIVNNLSTDIMSGTSMAAPHVAGIAALYLSRHPNAAPAEVAAAVAGGAVAGKITNAGSGSPNLLANSLFQGGGQPVEPQPQPIGNELRNGEPVNGLAGSKGEEKFFEIVPNGARRVTVSISGGTGDADLYVRNGNKPTPTSYSCRPYKSGNNETCNVNVPNGTAKVHVMLRAYSNFAGVKLSASY